MEKKKNTVIAIVGNPNSGKTTLFNALTGSNQRVGNWPGVTVEKKTGSVLLDSGTLQLVDLPGIYSLSSHSEDERVARDYLLSGEANVVINIVDASNLERNLFLTTHMLEMGLPIIVVLNMMDLAVRKGLFIDPDVLSKELGVPVISINATNNADIGRVKTFFDSELSVASPVNVVIRYPDAVEKELTKIATPVSSLAQEMKTSSRWLALKLLEGDTFLTSRCTPYIDPEHVAGIIRDLEKNLGESVDTVAAGIKYEQIASWTRRCTRLESDKIRPRATERIDRVVLNRFLGIPLFLLVMYGLFSLVLGLGGAFIDFFDILFGAVFVDGLALVLQYLSAPDWLIALFSGGIGTGLQAVATFIPIMFFMFFFLSVLEDSGYMARAAFVMDRALRVIGLPGKAFIPLIVGFGCTVPAVMATRTLENKRDRYLTVFMTPFMSCGARLPVYALFGATFFGPAAGSLVMSLYLAGIILAVVTGFLLRNTVFKGQGAPFVMELPPYHVPRAGSLLRHTWLRLQSFVSRAGRVIVLVVAILGILNTIGTDGSFGNEDSEESVLAVIGKGITPVFSPMGIKQDNWPATVGIFTGLFAKEAVVGTLNGLYGQMTEVSDEVPEGDVSEIYEWNFFMEVSAAFASIPAGLAGFGDVLVDPFGFSIITEDEVAVADAIGSDTGVFASLRAAFGNNPHAAYAYLLFILIYFPCIAALGAIIRETGTLFGIIAVSYLTVLAWVTATLYFQVTSGGSILWIGVALGVIVMTVSLLVLGGSRTVRGLPKE